MITLETITRAAREKGLEFLLAGGHAVVAHGHHRMTVDADFVIRQVDRDRWLELLRSLGYEPFHEGPAFLQFISKAGDGIPVDLMFTNDRSFDQFKGAAIPHPLGSKYPEVVSLRHLVATKCHAVRHANPRRAVKDIEDVINLVMANHVNIEDKDWRELILKYGTADFYEKLKRTCKG